MKILITGSSGHLGEAICRKAKEKEIDHIGIDLLPSPFTTHVGNLADRDFVQALMHDIDYVIHAATLHKPHVATHSKQDFVAANITGTLNLLEEAKLQKVKGFIFTSTTSTFGDSITNDQNQPAKWVTEETPVITKNIYGVTKMAAENLCKIFWRNHQLPCLVLRTSRFFLEEDDKKQLRENYDEENLKVNEYLSRRVDMQDNVDAHFCALEKVEQIGFATYIISASSPFREMDMMQIRKDTPALVRKLFPDFESIYNRLGWKMSPSLDRVYINEKARRELDWQPKYDFGYILNCLKEGKEYRSPLAIAVGKKRYHQETFEDGPYPVSENN